MTAMLGQGSSRAVQRGRHLSTWHLALARPSGCSSWEVEHGHLPEKGARAQTPEVTSPRVSAHPFLLASHLVFQRQGCALPAPLCVPRKQEELVQQVRKRLEEALMADMLAHVEELARDGEAPLDKPGADEDDEDEDEDEEPDQDADMEHI